MWPPDRDPHPKLVEDTTANAAPDGGSNHQRQNGRCHRPGFLAAGAQARVN